MGSVAHHTVAGMDFQFQPLRMMAFMRDIIYFRERAKYSAIDDVRLMMKNLELRTTFVDSLNAAISAHNRYAPAASMAGHAPLLR
jgi:hypothetical protein